MKRKVICLLFLIMFICTNVYALEIEYDGNEKKIKADAETFLESINDVYPGDVIEDTITIKNSSDEEKEVFLLIEVADQDTDTELLEKMNLSITVNYNESIVEIYNGEYSMEKLGYHMSLGTYSANTSGKVDVKITVPTSLDNEFALEEFGTKWTFYVDGTETQVDVIDSTTDDNITTGDSVIEYISILNISLISLILIVMINKRGVKGDKVNEKE